MLQNCPTNPHNPRTSLLSPNARCHADEEQATLVGASEIRRSGCSRRISTVPYVYDRYFDGGLVKHRTAFEEVYEEEHDLGGGGLYIFIWVRMHPTRIRTHTGRSKVSGNACSEAWHCAVGFVEMIALTVWLFLKSAWNVAAWKGSVLESSLSSTVSYNRNSILD